MRERPREVACQRSAAHDIVRPALRTAGLNDDVEVLVGEVRMEDLIEVRRRHTGLGLEVRADEVQHEGDLVLAVALQCRELRTSRAVDQGVDRVLIGIRIRGIVAVGGVGTRSDDGRIATKAKAASEDTHDNDKDGAEDAKAAGSRHAGTATAATAKPTGRSARENASRSPANVFHTTVRSSSWHKNASFK